MKRFLLPALAFTIAVPALADNSVQLDIVKKTVEKIPVTLKCKERTNDYSRKPWAEGGIAGNFYYKKIITKTHKETKTVVTGFDAEGQARVKITTNPFCGENLDADRDETLPTKVEVKLIAKSGEAFAQPDMDYSYDSDMDVNAILKREARINDLVKYLGRATERCPLSLLVGGEGAYRKHEFNCKVFSEDAGSSHQMRMESGELLDAPAT